MKQGWKRLTALLLMLALLFSAAPLTSLAAGGQPAEDEAPAPILYLDMEDYADGYVTNRADNTKLQVAGTAGLVESANGTQALLFDGTTTYINAGRGYQVTDTFTMAAWMWVDSSTMERAKLFSTGRTGVEGEAGININVKAADRKVWYDITGFGWDDTKAQVELNQWQHVAVVGQGNTLEFYINGVLQDTITGEAPLQISAYTTDLLIGAGWNNAGDGPHPGHMLMGALDEVRLYDEALNAGQIADLTTAGQKEPAKPILHLDMENIEGGKVTNLADGKQFDIGGNLKAQRDSVNGTQALEFDGTSTYINVGTEYQVTDALTMAAWMWIDDATVDRAKLFSTGRTGQTGDHPIGVNVRAGNGQAVWFEFDGLGWGETTAKVELEKWQHVAVTAEGTTLKVYINGQLRDTVTGEAPLEILPYSTDLLIGAGWNSDGTGLFHEHVLMGALDEVRLYDQALSAEEIAELAHVEEEVPDEDDPYLKQDGTPAYGIKDAVVGKRHWLENTEEMPVEIKTGENTLVMSNGAISREFVLPEEGGTNFYTKSYQNTYINKEMMTGESHPEVYLGLYTQPYGEVYEGKTIKVEPEYYYIGGTQDPEHTFVYQGYTIGEMDKPFEWVSNPTYGDPASGDWPPPGKHVEFTFKGPESSPYKDVTIKVIYEMYDNCAAMKKRVEITNTGDSLVMIGRLAPEALRGNQNMDDLLYFETTYTCGADGTVPIDNPAPCNCAMEKLNSPFRELRLLDHSCYDLGPAYELTKGQSFVSFDTYEVVYSTYWFEQQSRERLGVYRKLFPWISDNPLTMHNTGALTREVIDHAAAAGFEMIIQSYSAPDSSAQMLTRDQATLDWYKEMVDYAHSKNVDIGIYQAQYTRGQYMGGAEYGSNDMGTWGTWCMASAAFDDYWDNFKYFVKYTGLDCVEIDGTYPGCACGNGEKHVNQDKETDPGDPTSTTSGNPSKYAVHQGYFDSKVKQWENAVRMLCKEFRDMGVYIKVPAWYYLSGGNKCGIGYEEVAWSQPRQEQLLYARQLMHNASYVRTMSMSWSHIPFAQYHGGGGDAMFTPFGEKAFDYNWVIAQTIGNGVASDYRGPAIYDDTVLPILQRWVNFYQRYRGIVNSDMVHISQATYAEDDPARNRTVKMDTLYHVNANNDGEKGLLWVYNQSDETRTEIITVPMYYTGLTTLNYPAYPVPGSMGKDVHTYGIYPPNYNWLPTVRDYDFPATVEGNYGQAAFVREGVDAQVLSIDSNGNAMLEVTLEPMSFTYFAIYDTDEVPNVEVTVEQVTGLEAEETAAEGVKLTWDADTELTVMEDGEAVEHPAQAITGYKIYRDGEEIGQTMSNSFTDTDVTELQQYTYTVSALVGSIEGPKSEGLQVTVGADNTAPTLLQARADGSETIVLTFSEAMEQNAAETVSNYALAGGQVKKAVLSEDGKTVTLTVEPLELLRSYALQIKNLTDASSSKNPLGEATRTIVYGYLAYYPMDGVEDGALAGEYGAADAAAPGVTYTSGTGKNGCVYFNAADRDKADLGSGIFKSLNTYSISFNFWPNVAESDEVQALLSAGQEETKTSDLGIYLQDGKLAFRTCNTDETKAVELLSKDALRNDGWNQVTVTRSGDTFALYLNGALQAETTVEGIGTFDSLNTVRLGAMTNHAGGDTTAHYGGRMDDLNLYATALTAAQAAENWASYQVYAKTKPIIDLDFEDIADGKITNQADGKEFEITGAHDQQEAANGSQAMTFTGSNYINMGSDYQLGGEFTVSAWINVATTGDNRNHKIFGRGWTTHPEGEFYACVRNGGYNISFSNMDKSGGGSLLDFESGAYVQTNTWTHFAVTCDGTTVKVYKDGVLHSVTGSANNLNLDGNTRQLLVGGGWNKDGNGIQGDHMFIGAMDEVRLYDMALTQDDIKSIMNGDETPEVEVTGVTLDKESAELEIGDELTLKATVAPADAANRNVTWTTSDAKVATVENGKVTAVAEGSATITVTTQDGGFKDTCAITVKEKPVESELEKIAEELESKPYSVSQSKVDTGAEAKAYMQEQIDALLPDGVTGTVNSVSFTAAKAGTFLRPNGIDGAYVFTVTLSDGKNTHTTEEITLEIRATEYEAPVVPSRPGGSGTTDKPAWQTEFYDVGVSDWYYDAVAYVAENGIMTGVDEGIFNPNGSVTRAMVWTVLARMDGVNTEGGSTWYAKAQRWAMETGVSDGTDPNGSITREQLAAMLYRYDGSPAVSGDLSAYPDAASVSDWAVDAMIWATETGLINGINGQLSPGNGATRAQLATMLMRFVEVQ